MYISDREIFEEVRVNDKKMASFLATLDRFGVVGFLSEMEYHRCVKFLTHCEFKEARWDGEKFLIWVTSLEGALKEQFAKRRSLVKKRKF